MENIVKLVSTETDSPENTEKLGEKIGNLLIVGDVVCLIGELGAGKTALTRGVGRGFGTTARVTSPTFTLINEYARPKDHLILYHLDCYRLLTEDDVETIGLGDILAADGALVIEWPQVTADWLPEDRLIIEIEHIEDDVRRFHLISNGPRSQAILESLALTHT